MTLQETTSTPPTELAEFAHALCGPFFQFWRRRRPTKTSDGLARRHILAAVLLAWLPLLLLSAAEGYAWGDRVSLTFLQDMEMHVRLLIAVPLLIAAERFVHRQLPPVVANFLERDMIPDAARPRFHAAIASAIRLRNSVIAEILLILVVYGVGVLLFWKTQSAVAGETWSGMAVKGELHPSLAGWWAICVSMPLFQFLLLRWYFRLFVWARFLWQVSRIRLRLVPMHPDGAAGLEFLTLVTRAYAPVLLSQGAVLAGLMANRIFYANASLLDFKVELFGTVGLMVLAILGPQLAFTPQLLAAQRAAIDDYGALAERYARDFDRKWLRGGEGRYKLPPSIELYRSFEAAARVRWAPFTWQHVVHLAVVTLLPVTPLLLTAFSAEEVVERVLGALF
jgi:hypothetical protein